MQAQVFESEAGERRVGTPSGAQRYKGLPCLWFCLLDEMIGPNHLKLGAQYKGSLGIHIERRNLKSARRRSQSKPINQLSMKDVRKSHNTSSLTDGESCIRKKSKPKIHRALATVG